MALRVKVSARAASQIRKAAEWRAENRPAAPGAVRTDIGEALALLAQQPGIGTAYEGARTKGVRRLLVGRIRYFIYYGVTPGTLELLAV
jgi:plasmid stabilization system protein ParE